MNQHASQRDRLTQRGLLRDGSQEWLTLRLLQSHGSEWTPAPELAKVSLQYCRAISCLRDRGFNIENRVEWHHGRKFGFYRLVGRRGTEINTKSPPPQADTSSTLFSPDQPERQQHRDDN